MRVNPPNAALALCAFSDAVSVETHFFEQALSAQISWISGYQRCDFGEA